MSIALWLKSGKIQTREPRTPGLPSPRDSSNEKEALITQTANDAAETVLKTTPTRKRKRGAYSHYDEETRCKIAKYAAENGVTRAARKFSADLGQKLNESTVRSMRDQLVRQRKLGQNLQESTLPKSPRGCPLLLGELDKSVQDWICKVRLNGGVINSRIVMATAEAIVLKFAKQKHEKFGGHIRITRPWAKSLLRRMNFVKRKGTKSVKSVPSDFDSIKQTFVDRVMSVIRENNVPEALVINWDQTGCQLVPGGDWTLSEKGSSQVTVSGLDDKRQMTLLLSVAMDGTLLPPQLIYAGKTERCLPKVDFPTDWDVTYTESHWSTEDSMLRYVDKVLVPYVTAQREGLPLSQCDQKAVALFDVFAAHRGDALLDLLKANGIIPLFVPAACTDKLQPLDLTVNKEYKDILKARFHDWYAREVTEQLREREGEGEDASGYARVDMKTSVLKPVHARWIVSAHEEVYQRHSLIRKGFSLAGLC